ncbi:fibronectin type III domain-containing protein [Candidatus Daviesbacteria bacterium]|nr:fibronectin type III domain-containing protein [Candidatus Daviesbacteria bacterium]
MSKLLPILLLIAGLVITVFLVLQQTKLFSKAGISDIPKGVKISNISDNSFTVSWVTEEAVPGFVVFGQAESLDKTALDDRDSGGRNSRLTHHITLKDLTPTTVYSFKIGSGAKVYDNKGKLYTQTTAPVVSDTPPLPESLLGKVETADNKVPAEALVYVNMERSTVLSSFIREDGNFLLTLNNARIIDLSSYVTLIDSKKINLTAQAGAAGTVSKELLFSDHFVSQTLTLQQVKEAQIASWPADLNNDGVINAIDFAFYIKSKLGL